MRYLSPQSSCSPLPGTGIVLSGGGARGAYEAGVLAGIMEVLRPTRPPFDIFSGTSVGALNAAYLAAHAHRPDLDVSGLVSRWQSLDVSRHLRLDLRGVLGFKQQWAKPQSDRDHAGIGYRVHAGSVGRALLSSVAIEELAREAIDWDCLHDHVQAGRVQALIIAALHIATGRTTVFSELAPGQDLAPSKTERCVPVYGPLGPDHILASAAIPLLYPARYVSGDYYCDGGVRFNTPISPAIRAGAERLLVISLLLEDAEMESPDVARVDAYQNPMYLIGKVLNALLLDPLAYDLKVLRRYNDLLDVMQSELQPQDMARVQAALAEQRGSPYRKVDTLVFTPSQDIGMLARMRADRIRASRFSSWLLARTAALGSVWESDLLSFVLFDAEFAAELIRLGRDDAVARAAEIRAFFCGNHGAARDGSP